MFEKLSKKYLLVAGIAVIIAAGSFFGGFSIGEKRGIEHPKTILIEGVSNITLEEASSTADFNTFWQAWQLVSDEHLKGNTISAKDKMYGAIRGLIGSLEDPYSDFFNPQDAKKFQDAINGNFSGIGAEIGFRSEQLVVIAPLKETPAIKAGLKPGDEILKIDAATTDGLSIDRAVSLIRGPENSVVTLLILRDGWQEPKEFKITRATITVPTLDLEIKDDHIAYVKLYAFNANASYLFGEAVQKMQSAGAKGIVLDLRGNPGGYLDTAVDLAEWFLPKKALVVSEVGRDDVHLQDFYTTRTGPLKDTPTVVLINAASASASEILAGALHDDRNIQLIGEKSFGKGTVQKLEILNDDSSLKLTVAHWVLPSGKVLEGQGLDPDIKVEITDEDVAKGNDPQLAKALEVLASEIGSR